MVVKCCCYGCDNAFVSGKVMGFFRFPMDKKNKELWLKNIGIKGFVPTKYSRVCVKHFTRNSYVYHETRRRIFLNKNAVPTIFNSSNIGGKKTQSQKRSFAYFDVNQETPPSNKEKEEFRPTVKQGKTIEESSTKKTKIESSTKKRGRPRKDAEKVAPSIEMPKACVDENKKEKPFVFDKTAFVLEHMGPSYLPKRAKTPKASLGKVKRYRYVLDFTPDEMQNPEMAVRMLRMARKKVQTQKAEIKVINEETTMLATKRTSLRKLLRLLVKVNREGNENTDTLANNVKTEGLNLEERMSCNSDFELDASDGYDIKHEMSSDDENPSEVFDIEDDESDDFMFEDEEDQSDKLSYEDVVSSDLKSNLETLEDDEYYIIQITDKDDCGLISN